MTDDLALRPWNVLSLCSGVGGLELGIHQAISSARAVCYVERGAYAAACLAARMEEGHLQPAPIHADLRSFNARPWRGLVDVVAAGFPCQPFSVAGKQAGAEDHRHLWPDVRRVLQECRPAWVFLENVPGIVRKGLRDVLADLAALGFDAEWGPFTASGTMGAGHKRERIFILAANPGRTALRLEPRRTFRPVWQDPAFPGHAGEAGQVANAQREGESQQGRPKRKGRKRAGHGGGRAAKPGLGGRLDGLDSRMDPFPSVPPVAVAVSNGKDRLRCAGNGVVPGQAAYAFRFLHQRLIDGR